MSLTLNILGCGSALPSISNFMPSQVLSHFNKNFLIDCGEGTQFQLKKYNIKVSNIDYIFISHLHGDHFFGLFGLISSYNLCNRERDLKIFGPKGLKEIIDCQFRVSKTNLKFKLYIEELDIDDPQCLFSDDLMEVYNIPLIHGVYTNGYLFREKQKKKNLIKEKIKEYNIGLEFLNGIKEGKDYIDKDSGVIIPNKELTYDLKKSYSYAYCSDTAYNPKMIDQIYGVDLLYHEATFLDMDKQSAKKTLHSTAKQAAEIASKANVKKLVIGHYSKRYKNPELLKREALEIFNNTDMSHPGQQLVIY